MAPRSLVSDPSRVLDVGQFADAPSLLEVCRSRLRGDPLPAADPMVKALMAKALKANDAFTQRREEITRREDPTPTAEDVEFLTKSFNASKTHKDHADLLVGGTAQRKALRDPVPVRPAGDGNANPGRVGDEVAKLSAKQRNDLLRKYLRFGNDTPKHLPENMREGTPLYADVKAILTLNDTEMGYAVQNEESTEFIEKLRDLTPIIAMVDTSTQISGRSITFPNFDFSGNVDAVQETGTVPTKAWGTVLGKTMFVPVARAQHFKFPKDWLDDEGLNMEARLTKALVTLVGEQMERDVVSGDGKEGPLGLYEAPFTTKETDNATLVLTPEDFRRLPYQIKAQYRRGAAYVVTRATMEQVMLFRTDSGAGAGTGPWMWRESMEAGQPGTLNGYPVVESEYAPAFADTAGSPAALFGDLSWYWVVTRNVVQIQRLVELHALTREIGIVADVRYDGAPILKDPYVKLVRKA